MRNSISARGLSQLAEYAEGSESAFPGRTIPFASIFGERPKVRLHVDSGLAPDRDRGGAEDIVATSPGLIFVGLMAAILFDPGEASAQVTTEQPPPEDNAGRGNDLSPKRPAAAEARTAEIKAEWDKIQRAKEREEYLALHPEAAQAHDQEPKARSASGIAAYVGATGGGIFNKKLDKAALGVGPDIGLRGVVGPVGMAVSGFVLPVGTKPIFFRGNASFLVGTPDVCGEGPESMSSQRTVGNVQYTTTSATGNYLTGHSCVHGLELGATVEGNRDLQVYTLGLGYGNTELYTLGSGRTRHMSFMALWQPGAGGGGRFAIESVGTLTWKFFFEMLLSSLSKDGALTAAAGFTAGLGSDWKKNARQERILTEAQQREHWMAPLLQ